MSPWHGALLPPSDPVCQLATPQLQPQEADDFCMYINPAAEETEDGTPPGAWGDQLNASTEELTMNQVLQLLPTWTRCFDKRNVTSLAALPPHPRRGLSADFVQLCRPSTVAGVGFLEVAWFFYRDPDVDSDWARVARRRRCMGVDSPATRPFDLCSAEQSPAFQSTGC